jgi:hypothetical protein
MQQTVYFHGGPWGLRQGDFILPPEETGAKSCSDLNLKIPKNPHRKDRVYLAATMDAAFMFGAQAPWREVAVYAVIPWKELEPDPDCSEPGLSFQCERAKIIQAVRISRKQRNEILAALGLKFNSFNKMPKFTRRALRLTDTGRGTTK